MPAYDLIQYRPNTGSPLTLNGLDYPCNGLNPVTAYASNRVKKMQNPGNWPAYNYPEGMEIELKGKIIGTGASDALAAASYTSRRLAFMTAFHVPLTVLTARKHGVLRIQATGMSEFADADVQIVSLEAPEEVDFPTVCDFQVQFFAFYPAFIGSSSTEYRLG